MMRRSGEVTNVPPSVTAIEHHPRGCLGLYGSAQTAVYLTRLVRRRLSPADPIARLPAGRRCELALQLLRNSDIIRPQFRFGGYEPGIGLKKYVWRCK
jgi:hypothetical protein